MANYTPAPGIVPPGSISLAELGDDVPIDDVSASIYSEFSIPLPTGTWVALPMTGVDFDDDGFHDDSVTNQDSGTATGTHSTTTLQDTSKSWSVDEHAGRIAEITGGTGSGMKRYISSNTSDTLTLVGTGTTPDGTSTYDIDEMNADITKMIVPADRGGKYLGIATINIEGNINGLRGIAIKANGVFARVLFYNPVGAVECGAFALKVADLNPGEDFEVLAYQSSGSTLYTNAGNTRTYFQLTKQRGT